MFKEILKTKPHNKHYLTKYINFIEKYLSRQVESGYSEIHHICPKAKDMFPEFSSLRENPWNKVKLPFRAHVIAHYMLYKAFDTESQLLSIIRTSGQHHVKNLSIKTLNTKTIEKLKKTVSERRKGKFTRGYDENGKPLVSDETKQKL